MKEQNMKENKWFKAAFDLLSPEDQRRLELDDLVPFELMERVYSAMWSTASGQDNRIWLNYVYDKDDNYMRFICIIKNNIMDMKGDETCTS